MFGFIAKATVGGVIAYGVVKVLEHYDVPAKLTELGTEVLDKMLIWFPDEVSLGKTDAGTTVPPQAPPSPPVYSPVAEPWRT